MVEPEGITLGDHDVSVVQEGAVKESKVDAASADVDDRFLNELVARAQAEGLQLTGEGGLLQHLTKRLLESALEGGMSDHLGYGRHDPAGRNGGNSGNGKCSQDSGDRGRPG